ncbi:sterol O-acyltransferase 1-like [Penaeus indicus]|uniref:sterol O-acyltransferase 1-like n=1 Tax=Penaeus indicus TaxID=29960 RepID=UPI00300C744E
MVEVNGHEDGEIPPVGLRNRSHAMNGDIASPVREVKQTNTDGEENVLRNICLRDKFKDLQSTLENELGNLIDRQLRDFKEENLPVAGGLASASASSFTSALTRSHSISRGSKKSNGQLPSRLFVSRPSLLKELLAVNHIESIYHIFVAILILLFFNKVLEEIIQTGSLNLDLSLIIWAFGGLDRVIVIWVCMFTSTSVLVYLAFHHWAHHRHNMPVIYDVVGGVTYVVYLGLFLHLPLKSLIANELPPASSFIVLCEQVRMFMKTWAFVRSNYEHAVKYKKDDNAQSVNLCPDFSHYLYFLFAPTLVYRDEYPRNDTCDWQSVLNDLSQVIGCLFYTHFLFVRFCIPVFQKFGQESFNGTNLLVAVFSCMFPGSLVLLCGFFAVLHAWLNAFAEMMRFADRMFYKDWWNSTSYARFYRTWNCVVHDWLYEYVYRDVVAWQRKHGEGCARLRCFPMLVVFFISSVVHEYILSFAFRFFYPVLLVMFGGFGVAFMFVNSKARQFNIFLWVTLIFGTGILMCLYSMEWYARINCPAVHEGFVDYLVPRSLYCKFSAEA